MAGTSLASRHSPAGRARYTGPEPPIRERCPARTRPAAARAATHSAPAPAGTSWRALHPMRTTRRTRPPRLRPEIIRRLLRWLLVARDIHPGTAHPPPNRTPADRTTPRHLPAIGRLGHLGWP